MMVMSTICSALKLPYRLPPILVSLDPNSTAAAIEARHRRRSVGAAAACVASVHRVRHLGDRILVLGLERAAAAAGGHHVGVLDLESGAGQAVDVVHARPRQIRQTEAVDDHLHAVRVPGLIVLVGGG